MTPDRIRQIFKALETGEGAAFFQTLRDVRISVSN